MTLTKQLVAVYGTLKQDGSNHGLLGDSPLKYVGYTLPKYKLLSMGSYPGAISGNDSLVVEVYEVTDNVLARLDQLEGHPTFYERLLVPIFNKDGKSTEAWLYTISHLSSNYAHRPAYNRRNKEGHIDWKYLGLEV